MRWEDKRAPALDIPHRHSSPIFAPQNAIANGLINTLASRDFHGLPANQLDTYVPGVVAATPAQMQALARLLMPLDWITVVAVGDVR